MNFIKYYFKILSIIYKSDTQGLEVVDAAEALGTVQQMLEPL